MADTTFLWHDYETFGVNTRTARPAQFACIRTDLDLNEVGAPMEIFCRPAPDFLPEPMACLVTGITPQRCLERGLPEHEFAAKIEQVLAASNTIGVGYNTIRYDDEITRFMFWRNLIEPYAREWQNGCARWDIIDLVRVTHALRPDGIVWPKNAEGNTSFKLTDLTAANGIAHEEAHDAVSDVRATIAMARLIQEKQPKLFDFYFKLRSKHAVNDEIGAQLAQPKPFLHLSSMYPASRAHLALVYPLGKHPSNANEVIVWDCSVDPSVLFGLDAATVRERMFTRADALPDGVARLPIKTIHINKSPVVIGNLKVLNDEAATRCGLDVDAALANAQVLAEHLQSNDLSALWHEVFHRTFDEATDVDEDLYSGFIGNGDRRLLNQLKAMSPDELARARVSFTDERLTELVFRYRARNFPESLSDDEQATWTAHCAERLTSGSASRLSLDAFFDELERLSADADTQGLSVIESLYEYAYSIAPEGD